jgi:hypothetical protein
VGRILIRFVLKGRTFRRADIASFRFSEPASADDSFVPPLKGLCFLSHSYPALKRWAKICRAFGAGISGLQVRHLAPDSIGFVPFFAAGLVVLAHLGLAHHIPTSKSTNNRTSFRFISIG